MLVRFVPRFKGLCIVLLYWFASLEVDEEGQSEIITTRVKFSFP